MDKNLIKFHRIYEIEFIERVNYVKEILLFKKDTLLI